MEISNGPKRCCITSPSHQKPGELAQVNGHMGLPLHQANNMGGKNKFKWIPTYKGVQYLGIFVDHHLPTHANFDKLMRTIRGKLIN